MADEPFVVDLGGAADAGGEAAAATSDVVQLAAEDTPESKLPPNAALQDDGSVKLTLGFPVTLSYQRGSAGTVRTETHAVLHMQRLNGAAMRAVFSAGAGNTVPTGIAQSLRMNGAVFNALWDRMDGADAGAAAQVLDFLLTPGAPKPAGPPSSPG